MKKTLFALIACLFTLTAILHGETVYLRPQNLSPADLVKALNDWQQGNKDKKIVCIVGNLVGTNSPRHYGFWVMWTPQVDPKNPEVSTSWLLENVPGRPQDVTNLINEVEKQHKDMKVVSILPINYLSRYFLITWTDKK